MDIFFAFVIKEARHILRDKRTMLILFGMPVVLMLLFGFAITTDVKNVRTVVVCSEMSPRTQQAVERLSQSEYFVITQTVNTPHEAEQLIRNQKADMALVFAQDHGVQIMVDGCDPNMAQQWTTYAQQTLAPAHSSLFTLHSSLFKGERIVVADIMTVPSDTIDSVWVKVARDQLTFGWIHENELLAKVSPDDPISQFIDFFSDVHLLAFLAFCVVIVAAYGVRRLMRRGAKIVHFNDIPSFYPTTLCLLVASSAVLYSSIQLFGPESWRHFYYHPSLNPFGMPLHLGLFVSSVWAIVIVAIATVDDVTKHLPLGSAILYLGGLTAVCAVDYVIFSITTLYYIGYPLLIAYYIFALRRLSLQDSI